MYQSLGLLVLLVGKKGTDRDGIGTGDLEVRIFCFIQNLINDFTAKLGSNQNHVKSVEAESFGWKVCISRT